MDLKTTYMGLELTSPIVPSASPLSQSVDKVRKMEDCGAGAVVMWSLFEEQIEHEAQELDYYMQYGTERFAESLSYVQILNPLFEVDDVASAEGVAVLAAEIERLAGIVGG